MGCADSKLRFDTQVAADPLLSDVDSNSMPLSTAMGRISSQNNPTSPVLLSTQHERLILELLPFKDVHQFHEWLDSVYVRGSWHEFTRDFLSQNHLVPEPDKAKLAQLTKDAVNSRNPKYLLFHPDKNGWTSEDHHIRFMATVTSDNLLKGLWSEAEWKKRNIDITKSIYEVLSYLRATASCAVDPNPPGYDG